MVTQLLPNKSQAHLPKDPLLPVGATQKGQEMTTFHPLVLLPVEA